MTAQELAEQMAVEYGRSALGQWSTYVEWLWSYDLPHADEDLARFEQLHRAALNGEPE